MMNYDSQKLACPSDIGCYEVTFRIVRNGERDYAGTCQVDFRRGVYGRLHTFSHSTFEEVKDASDEIETAISEGKDRIELDDCVISWTIE